MISIRLVNLSHSDISRIHSYVFKDCENIGEIDLSSSLISNIDSNAFDHLHNVSLLNLNGNLIRSFEKSVFQQLINSIKKINLDNNPIQCDCSLEWYLEQRSNRFKLPDVCTGPIGYECLSPNELQQSQLPCHQIIGNNNQTKRKNFCEKREKDLIVARSTATLERLNTFLVILIIFIFKNKILFLV
jgi:Leucine Rich Repeat (LRR) protein